MLFININFPNILWITLALLLSGCPPPILQSDRNAPGISNIHTPPARPQEDITIRPDDPGQHMFTLNAGIFIAGGVRKLTAHSLWGAFNLGTEVSLHYGNFNYSPPDDSLFTFPIITGAINLGVLLVDHEGLSLGEGYLEAQILYAFMGVAGGYTVNWDQNLHGPQATVFLGPFFCRFKYHVRNDASLLLGISLKYPLRWTFSR